MKGSLLVSFAATASVIATKIVQKAATVHINKHSHGRGRKSVQISKYIFADVVCASYFTFGDDPTPYLLSIDTGSALTFVGVSRDRVFWPDSTFKRYAALPFSESFGDGSSINGNLLVGPISPAKGLRVNSTLGGLLPSESFSKLSPDVDGLFGLSVEASLDYVLTTAGFDAATRKNFHPFMFDAVAQGALPVNTFGLGFTPQIVEQGAQENAVTLGGYDEKVLTSEIMWSPVQGVPGKGFAPAWNVDFQIPAIGLVPGKSGPLPAGLVDSGTVLLNLPGTAFANYVKQLPNGVFDPDVNFVRVLKSEVDKVKSLDISIATPATKSGRSIIKLRGESQFFSDAVATKIGLDVTKYAWSWIGQGSTEDNYGAIFGLFFHQYFYVIYDASSSDGLRVGIATTKYS
ncbi:hypothetical protein E5Q_01582 [Mixia osmundae IAM 14324]|uniref:Peptidase A1 domain-containing protein n=1 Tax=Mixia osmundae (strain CBS 9802 / IAM 14324 / JCM 22182 / KY 12970) TaxID=764103 RepID=G7DWG7_MIXOS|nr:hypothetical protein E5Q_01582 [Mixia osmundae IAM 14324]